MTPAGPLVLVFVQTGCPACDEFMRRFDPIAGPYHRSGQVPVQIGDVARGGYRTLSLADAFKVEATPTTVGVTRTGETIRLIGAVDNRHIKQMFENVWRG